MIAPRARQKALAPLQGNGGQRQQDENDEVVVGPVNGQQAGWGEQDEAGDQRLAAIAQRPHQRGTGERGDVERDADPHRVSPRQVCLGRNPEPPGGIIKRALVGIERVRGKGVHAMHPRFVGRKDTLQVKEGTPDAQSDHVDHPWGGQHR